MGDRVNEKDKCAEITLTKPYYMGVFEVTQKQYELVRGANPSEAKGERRPVEKVSYNMIRGADKGAQWPAANGVDGDSFIGIIRERTNLALDLPTEAQWEYACRAGTTSAYNNGGDSETDLKKLGRYAMNQAERGWKESDASFMQHRPDNAGNCACRHTVVGSYVPNAWGLYDMHGNVWEWCLDRWYVGSVCAVTDPEGPSTGSERVRCGGSWDNVAHICILPYSIQCHRPSFASKAVGFRLAIQPK